MADEEGCRDENEGIAEDVEQKAAQPVLLDGLYHGGVENSPRAREHGHLLHGNAYPASPRRCASIGVGWKMAAAASWAAKLKLHNQKHPPAPKTEGISASFCELYRSH